MAGRREKLRRVGIIPEYRGFTPDGLASGDAIDMTVDELEVLRLCDLEGLNQEEVAQHMGIARATVAAISAFGLPCISRPKPMFCSTVMCGNSA